MLPIYIVLTFFLAALTIAFSKSSTFAKNVTLVAHLAALVLAVLMAAELRALDGDSIRFVFGAEPWNFHVWVTTLDAFMVMVFVGVNLLIMWASTTMIGHDIEKQRIPLYYILMNVLIASLVGIVIVENFFNIFFMIELSSFVAAGIVIIKNNKENMKAGLKYLSLSILGSSIILMGIITFYFLTGEFSLTGIYYNLLDNYAGNEAMVVNGLFFITVGVALKGALFPLHIWLPDAHGSAPSPSSAVLSALVLKAYIYLYIKILYKAIGTNILMYDSGIRNILFLVMIVGAIAMIYGSMMALLQKDIKRMIAYSSVAQIGYIFMGIGMGTRLGLFAALFHILSHALTKATLFLIAGSFIEQTHERNIDRFYGIGYTMPISTALFTIGGLSMVGIPLFAGFNSKWFFAISIVDSANYLLLGVLVASALLNGCYYFPIIIRAYFGEKAQEVYQSKVKVERPLTHLLPIIILGATVVLFAIFTTPIYDFINIGMDRIISR